MGLLDCCKCISFFGILFYVAMGFIIMSQVEFLKFKPEDQKASVGACFVTAVIELVIFVGIIIYQNCQGGAKKEEKENYYDLRSERDFKKEMAFKEIAMGDLKMIREKSGHE